MNDLLTPLLDYPIAYGFLYITRIFWFTFALLTFIRYVRLTKRVWRDFNWWAQADNGLGVKSKRVVAEGRFAMKVWLSIASGFIVASALLAISSLLFSPLPKPELSITSSITVLVLLVFIFCFYKAASASERIDIRLKEVVREEELKEE